MKKFLATILSAAMLMCGAFICASCTQERQILNVYTNAGFAPFEYVNTKGEVVGVDIDIINAIGKKLGYKVVINDIEFDNILVEVEKDELAVGAAGMSKRTDRDEIALASDIYATSKQYVIAPIGTFGEGTVTLADIVSVLNGKKVGVQKGTTGSFLFTDNEDNPEYADFVLEYSNAIIASEDIGSTLNAVVIDKLPAQQIAAASNNTLACWEIDELDAETETYVLYFNLKATELVKKVNEILAEMKENGTIDGYIVNHSSGK